MDIVWNNGLVTVQDVVDAIGRDLAYTTVMTTLKILEEKKIVERGEKIGRAYTYRALVTRDEVRQGMVHALAAQFFGGSVRSLVLSMIQSEAVSRADIDELREAAAKLEQRR